MAPYNSNSENSQTDGGYLRLWIEEIVLFQSPEDLKIIRSIPLKRGFNIIWGNTEENTTNELPGEITGHSVGKTSLCRLIRYALGEPTFGRKKWEEAVRQAFPKGAVGLRLHLAENTWFVLRYFDRPTHSFAAQVSNWEELIRTEQTEADYSSFQTELSRYFLSILPTAQSPTTGTTFCWEHFLGWIARDQETRFQNLWEWRSSRSESGISRLKKEDAFYLMKMVLGLLHED